MSAKGRGLVSANELEFFPTPRWVVESLLEQRQLALPGGRWIEPCAGTGRIIATINGIRDDVQWIICEIHEEFDGYLRPLVRAHDILLPYGDFVHREWPFQKADVLIMNPPFSLTMQFVEAAFARADWVVCLQRKNWFGSKGRSTWFAKHCPDDYTLPDRPSFRPDGQTDNCEYSWFVWPPDGKNRRAGQVFMLDDPRSLQAELNYERT